MKRTASLLLVVVLLVLGSGVANAAGLSWRDHAPPFSFLFGNHVDAHQQSLVRDGKLLGFFYIQYTGMTTPDGVPVAVHGDCPQVQDECVAGWLIKGIRTSATLVGFDDMGEPVWAVSPKLLKKYPTYSHFHWLGAPENADGLTVGQSYTGYLIQFIALDTFFFMHHADHGVLVTPGIDTTSHNNLAP